MVRKRADISPLAGFCILLILAVSIAGCTGTNTPTNTPVTTSPATPAQPVLTTMATTAVQPLLTTAQTTAPESVKTETQPAIQETRVMDPVSLTINSAKKQTKVYTMTPYAGRIFLVLDITVKNNAIEKGFDFTDTSITLSYPKADVTVAESITTKVRGGLENPIITPTTIEQNDQRTGQIVFSVAENSGKYILNLIDDSGTVVSSRTITA